MYVSISAPAIEINTNVGSLNLHVSLAFMDTKVHPYSMSGTVSVI